MRPEPPHDPAVKLVEEPADVGLAIVLAPSSNDRVVPPAEPVEDLACSVHAAPLWREPMPGATKKPPGDTPGGTRPSELVNLGRIDVCCFFHNLDVESLHSMLF